MQGPVESYTVPQGKSIAAYNKKQTSRGQKKEVETGMTKTEVYKYVKGDEIVRDGVITTKNVQAAKHLKTAGPKMFDDKVVEDFWSHPGWKVNPDDKEKQLEAAKKVNQRAPAKYLTTNAAPAGTPKKKGQKTYGLTQGVYNQMARFREHGRKPQTWPEGMLRALYRVRGQIPAEMRKEYETTPRYRAIVEEHKRQVRAQNAAARSVAKNVPKQAPRPVMDDMAAMLEGRTGDAYQLHLAAGKGVPSMKALEAAGFTAKTYKDHMKQATNIGSRNGVGMPISSKPIVRQGWLKLCGCGAVEQALDMVALLKEKNLSKRQGESSLRLSTRRWILC